MIQWQLGLLAYREGRMREAADRLQAALDESELTVSQTVRYQTCAYLGAALYALGLPARALTAFETAFRFSHAPVPPADLLMNLAHAYLAAGRRSTARQTLDLLLTNVPGHVAAGMLAARLDSDPAGEEAAGAVLGTSPETAQNYIRTLTFSRSAAQGYEPAEVQEALAQLGRYISGLTQELEYADTKMAQYEREVLRYRQMEDAVVESMVQGQSASTEEPDSSLSPIEILFRQKI